MRSEFTGITIISSNAFSLNTKSRGKTLQKLFSAHFRRPLPLSYSHKIRSEFTGITTISSNAFSFEHEKSEENPSKVVFGTFRTTFATVLFRVIALPTHSKY